jgi:adenosine kinase
MPILVSGSLVYDHIMDFHGSFKDHIMPENLHILNVAFGVDGLVRGWGGTGGNIAYNINLLGGTPILLSAVGKDGDEYLKRLEDLGVGTSHIRRDENKMTAFCYITTDMDDNQITAFHKGPNDLIGDISLSDIKEKISVAIISPVPPDVMISHLRQCRELGIDALFDPGQEMTAFGREQLQKAIAHAAFVFGNDYEMKLIEKRTGFAKEEILAKTRFIVTTLGKNGCLIETHEGEKIAVAACPSEAVEDPTGAGDAFRAGFFVGYERGYDLATCARMGNTAASFAIETVGTQEHHYAPEEFRQRYERAYNETLELG